ncbi:glycosyltransferase family 9 protein [Flavobacterium sp. LS1R49]|uniref:Glycosyltransferase family 9 protein n=1 Tax=Flavobacterium shii TaxID=2987687 RepID=A0A9X2ZCL8_9FLAO|nr:glycosyltransferase family 9 protein [Flavobacterium shii]MCV9926865.1 glycosyltransferase family 9 protein [Flavobacterium shii]
MKILIIQQKRIGDVLLSSILCNNLKKKYPESTIDFMCYPNCTDVLIGNPNIDNVITLTDKVRKSYLSLFKFIFKIRSHKYNILIDVYGKLETNLITIFSGADYKISYYKWYSSLFYNHNMTRFDNNAETKYGLAVDNRLLLLKPLNLDSNTLDAFPKLYVSEKENQDAIALFVKHKVRENRKIVMISLLGSEKSKTYPLEHMAKVVEYVAENKDVTILFNYFPNQIEDAQKVFDLCSKSTQEKIHFDLLGSNLRSFIAIMNQCDVIIGNDGGAINMGKALNKPSFIIFSPYVEKNDWATFEDGLQNISVHLNDFKPELINNIPHKEIKSNSASLYQQFHPELFKDQIKFFMAQNL